jgi:iron complex transport system permease protein
MLRRLSYGQTYVLLAALLAVLVVASAAIGAFSFTPAEMVRHLGAAAGLLPAASADALSRNVFLELRLPRVLLAGVTGAVLGVSGTFTAPLGSIAVPVLAFAGAVAATMLVYRLSTSFGKVNVFTLLLAGIAVNAVCAAGTGFLSYVARDPQARNITFWNLGTFTTADWRGTIFVGVFFAVCFAWSLRYGKALNALMLGEDEAAFLGVDSRTLIFRLLVVNTRWWV